MKRPFNVLNRRYTGSHSAVFFFCLLLAVKDKKKNEKSQCFVLVISSHGTEEKIDKRKGLPREATEYRHAVIGSDGKRVYVDEIMKLFEDTEGDVNGLNGKPKLVFLQVM